MATPCKGNDAGYRRVTHLALKGPHKGASAELTRRVVRAGLGQPIGIARESGPQKPGDTPAHIHAMPRFGADVPREVRVRVRRACGKSEPHDCAIHIHMSGSDTDFAEIREAVRRVCTRFPGSYWRALEEADAYPADFVTAMTEAGFLSALIPESYGGTGLPLRAAAAILEEIHASGCNAAACHAQMYIMGSLLRHGSDAQKQRYLPEIAAGRLRLQAFGVTEPTSGSDTTSLATRAVRDGADYVVTGQKVWTSRAFQSDLMLLLARTTPLADVRKKSEGLSLFLVDMKTPGISVKPLAAMINHNTTEVFFDQARVPAENLIGQEGKGFSYVLDSMNAERLLIAAECLGDGRWFTEKSVGYTKERQVFGRPIGQNQGVQFPIARAYAELRAAELMVREGCARFDAGRPCGPEAIMGKMLASEASWHAAEACLQSHGGFGFAREYDVERKWRETRLYQIAPISTNLILSYVAEHVLGLPRSY